MEGWTSVCPVGAVSSTPCRVDRHGTEVVLWRRPDGSVAAVDDRCPHNGWRLSAGWTADDGCIRCPGHGWAFDADGHRVEDEAAAGSALHALLRAAGVDPRPSERVAAYDVVEADGAVLVRPRRR